MYTISWYNQPYKRWLIGDEHVVWLWTRNVFGGSIITTYVYVLFLISYKGLLFSWMIAHPILIICFEYKCMHWHRVSRKLLPRSQEQCLTPRNLYPAAQYARNRYDSPGWYCILKRSYLIHVCLRPLKHIWITILLIQGSCCNKVQYISYIIYISYIYYILYLGLATTRSIQYNQTLHIQQFQGRQNKEQTLHTIQWPSRGYSLW